jgi:hypothetical protein
MTDKGVHANVLNRKFFKYEERQEATIMRTERVSLAELDARRRAAKRRTDSDDRSAAVASYDGQRRPLKPPGR